MDIHYSVRVLSPASNKALILYC